MIKPQTMNEKIIIICSYMQVAMVQRLPGGGGLIDESDLVLGSLVHPNPILAGPEMARGRGRFIFSHGNK